MFSSDILENNKSKRRYFTDLFKQRIRFLTIVEKQVFQGGLLANKIINAYNE